MSFHFHRYVLTVFANKFGSFTLFAPIQATKLTESLVKAIVNLFSYEKSDLIPA